MTVVGAVARNPVVAWVFDQLCGGMLFEHGMVTAADTVSWVYGYGLVGK